MTTESCCSNEKDQSETCPPPRPEWSVGIIRTAAGEVCRVSTDWSWSDQWGRIKSRISAYRMKYIVIPGLYAVGEPGQESDVFASANYKLSFDILRRSLKGLNAWILVLDTQGINVWCAAGKGTFGTDELVRCIRDTHLDKVISHKRVVVPQLGASGVSAHRVKKESGFRVLFGPVHARDIPVYLRSNYHASGEIRSVKFSLLDRLVLTPMEILPAIKIFLFYTLSVLILFGLQPAGLLFKEAWTGGAPFLFLGVVSIFAGAFITPLFLPFIPFRSFGIKGWIVGMICVLLSLRSLSLLNTSHMLLVILSYIFFPAASSYIALQFTGSTPFTGRSGVQKELKIAIPFYAATLALSSGLFIVYKLKEWGVV